MTHMKNIDQTQKVFVDGLRQVGEDNFYDSNGQLVVDIMTTPLNYSFDEPNVSQMAGLTVYYEKFGDIFSEIPYDLSTRRCWCV